MKAMLILAILAAAWSGATAVAQPVQERSEPAPLTELLIDQPTNPTPFDHHDVGLKAKKPVGISTMMKQVRATVDGVTTPVPQEKVKLTTSCGAGEVKGSFDIQTTQPCILRAELVDVRRPGRYTAKISLIGKAGDSRDFELDFARRESIWWAIGLVLLGLITGFVIMSWLGSGRERSLAVISIKEAVANLLNLDGSSGKPARMADVLFRGREMERAILHGAAADSAEVTEIQKRVSQYRFLLAIEARGSKLSGDKQLQLAIPVKAAIEAMQPASSGKLVPVDEGLFTAAKAKLLELEQGADRHVASAEMAPDLPLPITQGMSVASARFAFALAEWGAAVILMLVFTVIALGTLYVSNAYWGGYGDLLAAFMIGFGAYAGSIASVASLLQRARTIPA